MPQNSSSPYSNPQPETSKLPSFVQGGGEMGELMRRHDWSSTLLGSLPTWPQALKTAIRLILNSGHPMYIWWGPQLLCFYNDAYRQSIGAERHPESLGGKGREVWAEIWDIVGPDVSQIMSGGGSMWRKNELVPITRDGRLEKVYWTYGFSPIDDDDAANGVGGVLVVCTETTEQVLGAQRSAEERQKFAQLFEALRESEEQLRLATDAAEVGLWDLDVCSGTLYWPARMKAMFGISAEVPVSMADFHAGLHPEDSEKTRVAFAEALDPGTRAVYDVEYRTIGKEDRLIRWVAAKGRALFDADRCVRVVGTAIDITARKLTEEKLRELNEDLERRVTDALAERKILADIVESTDSLVLALDQGYRIMAINRAMADALHQVYGITATVGGNLLGLLDGLPEQQEIASRFWSRALAGEEFTAIEEFGDSRLDLRHYEMKFNCLHGRDGELFGAFQFVQDVTDRIRDQKRLADAENTLRQAQKIEALGQLTGGVAHDFNNLLMVISGGLSLLERAPDPERRQRIVSQMRQATDRGASLSRQLLAFSRRQPLKPEPVNLQRQIDGMRELLDRTLRGDVLVRTELAVDLWPIEVDPAELELVVLNLCVNARDAMPTGGTITIIASNAANVVDGQLAGDFVSLSVEDCGTGMSDEVLSHMFEPFFTTKEVGKGSGLGLPQVYGFAQQSGGCVKVDSMLGRGTRMTLLLPRSGAAAEEKAPSTTEPETVSRPSALRESILLVEDDDEVASLVTQMLCELGYRVTRAASAQAALGALADDRSIDLVFSDVLMPGNMNGMELAREVRRRRPHMPVLLTSGYTAAALKDAGSEDIGVLRKPYEIQTLDVALRAAFAGRGSRVGW